MARNATVVHTTSVFGFRHMKYHLQLVAVSDVKALVAPRQGRQVIIQRCACDRHDRVTGFSEMNHLLRPVDEPFVFTATVLHDHQLVLAQLLWPFTTKLAAKATGSFREHNGVQTLTNFHILQFVSVPVMAHPSRELTILCSLGEGLAETRFAPQNTERFLDPVGGGEGSLSPFGLDIRPLLSPGYWLVQLLPGVRRAILMLRIFSDTLGHPR